MATTNVRHHYRQGGKVSVTQHTRKIEGRVEREKFEKPDWTKKLDEDGNEIILSAETKGKKHKSVLVKEKDIITVEGKKIEGEYAIYDYEHGNRRGSFFAGNTKEEALSKFEEQINDWNVYNTSLGKLYKTK